MVLIVHIVLFSSTLFSPFVRPSSRVSDDTSAAQSHEADVHNGSAKRDRSIDYADIRRAVGARELKELQDNFLSVDRTADERDEFCEHVRRRVLALYATAGAVGASDAQVIIQSIFPEYCPLDTDLLARHHPAPVRAVGLRAPIHEHKRLCTISDSEFEGVTKEALFDIQQRLSFMEGDLKRREELSQKIQKQITAWYHSAFKARDCDELVDLYEKFPDNCRSFLFELKSPLHLAAECDSKKLISCLRDIYKDSPERIGCINTKDEKGMYPIHTACYYASLPVIDELLDFLGFHEVIRPIEIEARNITCAQITQGKKHPIQKIYPFMIAALLGRTGLCKTLLAIKNSSGEPFHTTKIIETKIPFYLPKKTSPEYRKILSAKPKKTCSAKDSIVFSDTTIFHIIACPLFHHKNLLHYFTGFSPVPSYIDRALCPSLYDDFLTEEVRVGIITILLDHMPKKKSPALSLTFMEPLEVAVDYDQVRIAELFVRHGYFTDFNRAFIARQLLRLELPDLAREVFPCVTHESLTPSAPVSASVSDDAAPEVRREPIKVLTIPEERALILKKMR